MSLTRADYVVEFNHLDSDKLLESWRWLIGFDKSPIMISSIGDMFLTGKNKHCYWLNVGAGVLEKVAESHDEFNQKLKDTVQVNNWFLPELIMQIKASGLELKSGFLFGFKKLPIIGGEYETENFELTDIDVHFSMSGQIHEQIKDLPNGTEIRSFSISD